MFTPADVSFLLYSCDSELHIPCPHTFVDLELENPEDPIFVFSDSVGNVQLARIGRLPQNFQKKSLKFPKAFHSFSLPLPSDDKLLNLKIFFGHLVIISSSRLFLIGLQEILSQSANLSNFQPPTLSIILPQGALRSGCQISYCQELDLLSLNDPLGALWVADFSKGKLILGPLSNISKAKFQQPKGPLFLYGKDSGSFSIFKPKEAKLEILDGLVLIDIADFEVDLTGGKLVVVEKTGEVIIVILKPKIVETDKKGGGVDKIKSWEVGTLARLKASQTCPMEFLLIFKGGVVLRDQKGNSVILNGEGRILAVRKGKENIKQIRQQTVFSKSSIMELVVGKEEIWISVWCPLQKLY